MGEERAGSGGPGAVPKARRLRIDEGAAGQRLDNYLIRVLKGVPKTHVYRVIRSGEVRVNKGRAQADTRLELGDEIRLPPVRTSERRMPLTPAREFPLVYEDEQLIAIDKPAGVAVHGGSGVSFGVIEQLRRARPRAKFLELVHRLDKETSGLLLIAKSRATLTNLQEPVACAPSGQDLCRAGGRQVAGEGEGDRRGAAQVRHPRWRAARAHGGARS